MMNNIDYMDNNDYFKMSLEERINLNNEITHDLQELVMNICSQWEDMSSSIDYNEFSSYVQDYFEKAMKRISFPYLCAHAWGRTLKWQD